MPKIDAPAQGESMIVWASREGPAAINFLNAIGMMECHLVPATAANSLTPGNEALFGGAGGPLIFQIPLRFAAPIANSSATAVSVSTQLNLLLQALRANGQNPS